jgi:SPX domain protein involved in polyphosphate accumulation
LKSELGDDGVANLIDAKRKEKRSKSIAIEIAEDDNEDDQHATKIKLLRKKSGDENNNNTALSEMAGSTDSALRKRTARSGSVENKQQQISNIFNGAQAITQRLMEKTRQRKLKQKQFRKEHDLKLAFSEFYLSLILLQNYQTLNFTGFRKILKKHDKVLI